MNSLLSRVIFAPACCALLAACADTPSMTTNELDEAAGSEKGSDQVQVSSEVTVADVAVGVAAGAGMFVGGVLYGLLSFSDERLKTDIVKVAETVDGIGIYTFRFLGDDRSWRGVMAQEVLEKRPNAVVRGPNGYLMVNYAMLGMQLELLD